jgi:hypothetical protein
LLAPLTEKVLFGVFFQNPGVLFLTAQFVGIKEWLTDTFGVVIFLNARQRFRLLLTAIRLLLGGVNFRRLATRCDTWGHAYRLDLTCSSANSLNSLDQVEEVKYG